MEPHEDIVRQCQRLICLLEDEMSEVSRCLKGDILDAYQSLLKKEIQQLRDQIYLLKTQ